MKRDRKYLIIGCLVMAMLAGCGAQGENPYRVDTVVLIPVDPTEPPAETAAEADETEAVTEQEATAEETQGKGSSSGNSPGSKTSSSGGKASSSSGKNSSSGNKNSSGSNTRATEPKETQPAATQPPVIEPVSTDAPVAEEPFEPSNYSAGSLEYAVLDAINAYRAEAGASALSMSTKLCGIAALRAQEAMVVWSHSRPDGRDFASALSDYGYGYTTASENLVYATDADAQAMVDKWMSSDSNRESLLSESLTAAGIGVYRSGGVTYVAAILVG